MNRIEDERLKFYLRHQELIETWANLADLIPAQVHEFLVSCKDALAKLAQELGPEVKYEYWDDDKHPAHVFYRRSWIKKVGSSVAICIQWYKPKAAFQGGNVAYSGVFLWSSNQGDKPHEQLSTAFHSRCDKPREGFGKLNAWAAAVRSERPPNGDYWDNLDPYKASLVESVRLAWKLYADDIDHVVNTIQP